ncbi:MAG: hypothetical protein HY238_00640 [Acidobacteria bacterium]|nr:hypothetical protein [Acidobacteriota bacterium]
MVYFREVQRFRQPWLWAILLLPVAVVAYGIYQQLVLGRPWGNKPMSDGMLLGTSAFVLLLTLWMYRMELRTEVQDDELAVHFFLLWKPKRIPLRNIRSCRAVTYSPIREYGGWGIRRGRRGWAYNVSGDRGVELELDGGKFFLVGTQRPEELVGAIEKRRAIG